MSPFPQVFQFLVVAVAGWINQQQRLTEPAGDLLRRPFERELGGDRALGRIPKVVHYVVAGAGGIPPVPRESPVKGDKMP